MLQSPNDGLLFWIEHGELERYACRTAEFLDVVSRSGAGCVSWLDYYMMYLSLSSSEDEDEGDEEEGLCSGCIAEEAFATCDGTGLEAGAE